jgi:hypothetical protein
VTVGADAFAAVAAALQATAESGVLDSAPDQLDRLTTELTRFSAVASR